jgi:hypothetical protein
MGIDFGHVVPNLVPALALVIAAGAALLLIRLIRER